MDLQELFNTAVGIIVALVVWIGTTLWKNVKALDTQIRKTDHDVSQIREHVPTNYVTKTEFSAFGLQLMSKLDRIEDKIDRKADKPN